MKLSKKEKDDLYKLLHDAEFCLISRKDESADEDYPDKESFIDSHNLLKSLYTIKGKILKDELGHMGMMPKLIERLNEEKKAFLLMLKKRK